MDELSFLSKFKQKRDRQNLRKGFILVFDLKFVKKLSIKLINEGPYSSSETESNS